MHDAILYKAVIVLHSYDCAALQTCVYICLETKGAMQHVALDRNDQPQSHPGLLLIPEIDLEQSIDIGMMHHLIWRQKHHTIL